jgi:hypothetical protein
MGPIHATMAYARGAIHRVSRPVNDLGCVNVVVRGL